MSLIDSMSMAKPEPVLRLKLLAKIREHTPLDCFNCLRCTSGCTALKLLELKPHEIMSLVRLGFVKDLAASDIIWTCATCLKCRERCPQKATPYDTIIALRNLAVEREAKIPEVYLQAVSQILENGLAQNPQKVITRRMESFDRESLGLPKITYPAEIFKKVFLEALEEHEW